MKLFKLYNEGVNQAVQRYAEAENMSDKEAKTLKIVTHTVAGIVVATPLTICFVIGKAIGSRLQ